MRFLMFRQWFRLMIERCRPDIVIYEQEHHRGGFATELLIGMTTRIMEICDEMGIDYRPIHSSTLKKFATGSGGAGKKVMLALARKKWGDIIDDNEADAHWILEWAKEEFEK